MVSVRLEAIQAVLGARLLYRSSSQTCQVQMGGDLLPQVVGRPVTLSHLAIICNRRAAHGCTRSVSTCARRAKLSRTQTKIRPMASMMHVLCLRKRGSESSHPHQRRTCSCFSRLKALRRMVVGRSSSRSWARDLSTCWLSGHRMEVTDLVR